MNKTTGNLLFIAGTILILAIIFSINIPGEENLNAPLTPRQCSAVQQLSTQSSDIVNEMYNIKEDNFEAIEAGIAKLPTDKQLEANAIFDQLFTLAEGAMKESERLHVACQSGELTQADLPFVVENVATLINTAREYVELADIIITAGLSDNIQPYQSPSDSGKAQSYDVSYSIEPVAQKKRKYSKDELYDMREIIRNLTPENAQCMEDTQKHKLIVEVWASKQLKAFNLWYPSVPMSGPTLEKLTKTFDPDRAYRNFLDKSIEVEKLFEYNLRYATGTCVVDRLLPEDQHGDHNPYLQSLKREMLDFEEAIKEERRLFLVMINNVYPDLDLSTYQPK
jgi:hypothetical protein